MMTYSQSTGHVQQTIRTVSEQTLSDGAVDLTLRLDDGTAALESMSKRIHDIPTAVSSNTRPSEVSGGDATMQNPLSPRSRVSDRPSLCEPRSTEKETEEAASTTAAGSQSSVVTISPSLRHLVSLRAMSKRGSTTPAASYHRLSPDFSEDPLHCSPQFDLLDTTPSGSSILSPPGSSSSTFSTCRLRSLHPQSNNGSTQNHAPLTPRQLLENSSSLSMLSSTGGDPEKWSLASPAALLGGDGFEPPQHMHCTLPKLQKQNHQCPPTTHKRRASSSNDDEFPLAPSVPARGGSFVVHPPQLTFRGPTHTRHGHLASPSVSSVDRGAAVPGLLDSATTAGSSADEPELFPSFVFNVCGGGSQTDCLTWE